MSIDALAGPDSLPSALLGAAGALPPAAPRDCGAGHHAVGRFEWRVGEPGDPAVLAEEFLAAHGLPVTELNQAADGTWPAGICGAALHFSAAAGAVTVGGPAGKPSPAPVLPDVAVVLYAHTPARPAPQPAAAAQPWQLDGWAASWTPQAHADAVSAVRQTIAAGDVYQVNLVGHAAARYRGDPLPALRRLAALPGARYGGVLTGRGWAIGCASPETLVQVSGGQVVTRPIKGTRPATAAGRAELLASVKERAEHVMIVDLERNDLARVARTGSVRVDELYAVRRWCDLWQAESTVSARLDDGIGLAALLRAVCPGGSVTGAPKLAALGEVARLEPVGRGAAMGALGWLGPAGLDLGLTIRTVAADGDRLHLWAGGGITWGSEPWAEVAEAAAKAAPLRAAVAASGGTADSLGS
ncbi:chorismate-binding protein [Melissospora conviva]|uniref:chorismate-binding protein n=1 Tax=Melissospora conviva TaxID=3388432 RepID=UPI003C27DA8E